MANGTVSVPRLTRQRREYLTGSILAGRYESHCIFTYIVRAQEMPEKVLLRSFIISITTGPMDGATCRRPSVGPARTSKADATKKQAPERPAPGRRSSSRSSPTRHRNVVDGRGRAQRSIRTRSIHRKRSFRGFGVSTKLRSGGSTGRTGPGPGLAKYQFDNSRPSVGRAF